MTYLLRITALAGTVSFIAMTATAHAADPAVEMPVRTGFNWTGFYVGAGVGAGAFGAGEETEFSLSGDGLFGEISAGYDHMVTDRILVGAFVDARYGGQKSSIESPEGEVSISQTMGFDVGVRAGYLLGPNTLAYVLGGYSWQRFELDGSGLGALEDTDSDGDGVTVGAGLETVLGGNWTLKNEYRYTSYSTDSGELSEEDISTHTYRIGVNYRFGAEGGTAATFDAPAYNWTGFYVGAQAGTFARIDETSILDEVSFDGFGDDGGWASLNVGYDHEFGDMWVAGVQASVRYMDSSGASLFLGGVDSDYGFDLVARIGAKVNESTLAYVVGGYTNQHFDLPDLESDWNAGGYTLGTGIETAVTDHMTLNVEYRFAQFDDHEPLAELVKIETRSHTFGVGLKYKFN